jgi:starch-binding outer membrane protein, SusD/RagB family
MMILSKHARRTRFWMLLVPLLACTDLTEVPEDALTPSNAFKTDEEVLAGVASVYAGLRGTMWGYYNLSEVTTDEIIVPTRGSDWYDNGRWLEIYRQTWTANSGSALDDMNGTWNDLFSGVARANLMIDVIQKAGGATATRTLAELRTLRAWYYYMLMDFFGGVPLVTSTEVAQNPRVSRDSLFRFIESELNAVRNDLPPTWPAASYGRVTRGAADAILASMYLNARVFTGSVTTAGLTPGTARWADAVTAANRVINSGVYSLATNWNSNFSPTNENSPENIFVIVHNTTPGLGLNLPMRTLHYNQLSLGPWNGFATIAETYNAFSAQDARRSMWLVGQQYSFNTGATIANADAATESEGVRYNKFPPLPGAIDGNGHPNDYPFYRLAEMYLIRAEAQNELGNTAAAIADINIVRARAFSPAQPLATTLTQAQVRTAVLNERLLELAGEGKRRQDLIRHGQFVSARRFKTAQGAHKILFPIPATQIQTNPKLTQNPGY